MRAFIELICFLSFFSLCVFSTSEKVSAEDWPAFRGPDGNGISSGAGFPTHWDQETNIKWRTPLPGPGNGSPIVIGEKVILLCAEDQGKVRSTITFDRNTGEQLWRQDVSYGSVEMTHKTNPYCPSTPVSDGERVYVWHRSAGMYCYDLDGTEIWSRDLGQFDHIWGGGSSPILYKNLLIQLCGPGERTFLVALDKTTGEPVWETPHEPGGHSSENARYVGTWSTPQLVNIEGQDRLICPYHKRTVTYDPNSGEEVSVMEGLAREKSDLSYASPMIENDIAVIMGGFGGPAFAFRLGGAGDTTSTHRLWHTGTSQNPQRIGSGVLLNGYLYMTNADGPGSLECILAKTGEQLWEVRRSSDGPHWASAVFADGKIYATGQKGTTTVFRPSPERFELIAENPLDENCNSTPAFSNGEVFLRTWDALYCIAEESF